MAGALEDVESEFADLPVAPDARKRWPLLFFATIGLGTALIYMQVVSMIALSWGSRTALAAIVYSTIVSSALAWPIARRAARTGRGTNLLARDVLGERGAVVFSLLYGITLFVFFIAEANIMATSIHDALPALPAVIVQPVLVALIVPIVWFGMGFLARFQAVSFILYAVLLLIAVARSLGGLGHDWLSYEPAGYSGFGTGLLAAFGIMNGLVFVTALISADFARYIRRDEYVVGPLWVGIGFQLFSFIFAGLLGLWFAVRFQESNPGSYFVLMLGSWGVLFAIATQIRINVANMYLGSLALVNAAVEITGVRVGRRLVIMLFALAAAVALVTHLAHFLETLLNLLGIFMITFTVLLVMSGKDEFAAPTLWRWPALASFVLANLIGVLALAGSFGTAIEGVSTFFACAAQILLFAAGRIVERRRA